MTQSMIPIHIHAPFTDSESDLILSALSQGGGGGSSSSIRECISHVLTLLRIPAPTASRVRSVSIYLDHMDGVAYTKGSDLDNAHKEIHLSTHYFASFRNARPPSHAQSPTLQSTKNPAASILSSLKTLGLETSAAGRHEGVRYELMGVLTHELVHCFQFDAKGTMPGGLVEGMADYIRLRANLAPAHWRRGGERWDEGYANTAYFLDWVDRTYGDGKGSLVCAVNVACDARTWHDDIFRDLTGQEVSALWKKYRDSWT